MSTSNNSCHPEASESVSGPNQRAGLSAEFEPFTEYVVVAEGVRHAGDALRAMLQRFAVEPASSAVRLNSVRRMTATEVARLHLEPSTGVWLEVSGERTGLPPGSAS